MSSHNSAISSRTDLNPVVSSQSLYIATVVGRLCCTHLLIHYNASPSHLCIIIYDRPEVYLFLRASSFFAFASTDSPVAFQPHFRAHFMDAMFAFVNFIRIVCVPIALVYMSFILRSIFLALNIGNVDLRAKRSQRITRRSGWICLPDNQHNQRQDVHRQKIGTFQA